MNGRSASLGAITVAWLACMFADTAAAQQTCSARCPDGSMSERYSCNDPNYVPQCYRRSGGSSGGSSGGAVGSGGYTPQQRMILNGARQLMPLLQQGVHDLFNGKLMTGNQTPFFGTKTPKCPPSQDGSVVDLCGRGDTVDPAVIKIDPGTASVGGSGVTVGQPDATIRTPQGQTAHTSAATHSTANPEHDANAAGPAPDGPGLAPSKLVPLLGQTDSGNGRPIATGSHPAICEPLSRQLEEVRQLARRAVLASDVYERYEPSKHANLPVMAGFDRISDNIDSDDMRRLFPGMDSQAVKSLIEPGDSDYRAAIYKDRRDPKKILLVFRGTRTLGDWANANAPQGAGLGSAYYAKAIALTGILKQSTAAQKSELEIVGHSLGGGMADAAGLANQVRTTSFNPSGVSMNTLPKGTDLSTASQYVTDNVVDGEPLNSRQDHPLQTRAELTAHSVLISPAMPAVVAASAATDLAGGGKTDYSKQGLQEIAALYSATLPAAIGRRVTLTPDPADLNSLDPLNLHYMSSVVDAIVAHSRDLYGQYVFNGCGS